MDLQNVSGGAISLTRLGIVIADTATATGIADKWLQDEDIAALVNDGKLVPSNYSSAVGSAVVQPEVVAAPGASHTHANAVELDLVTDGDHDVSDGSSHANVATNSAHSALVAGNPHSVTPAEALYTPAAPVNWAGSPANLQDAVDRLAAHITAGGGAVPIV